MKIVVSLDALRRVLRQRDMGGGVEIDPVERTGKVGAQPPRSWWRRLRRETGGDSYRCSLRNDSDEPQAAPIRGELQDIYALEAYSTNRNPGP